MSAPRSSRAYGKQWGDTTVPVGQSKAEIDKTIRKFDRFAHIQWTDSPSVLQLRFRSNMRNYVFAMPQYEDDPSENRRTVRAVAWYLKGLLGLDVEKDDPLYPERALLPYLEMAPDLTVADMLEDDTARAKISTALGGRQLALSDGEAS